MQVSKCYWYFSSVITSDQCQQIINLGEEKLRLIKESGLDTKAHTFGSREKKDFKESLSQKDLCVEEIQQLGIDYENVYVRDSEVAWLDEQWIYDLITPFIQKANFYAGWNFDLDYFESFQFTKYNSPGGFYGWHCDANGDWHSRYKRYIPGITHLEFTNPKEKLPARYSYNDNFVNKVRKISITLNLSVENSYEGGNLKFDFGPHTPGERFKECVEIRPQGSIIVFPSFEYHCVTPVTKGTRYSLVLWALGAPFK